MNLHCISIMLMISFMFPLSLRAEELRTIADTMRQQSGLQKLLPRKFFSHAKSNISNLDDLDQIPGIETMWAVNLPGNRIGTIKAGTFKNPKFKNIRWLNLSHNRID